MAFSFYMEVKIKSCLEGAKSAEGLVVIIDVINACSTIVECFEKGAREIVPVSSMEEAVKRKGKNGLICGEMKNFRIRPDFFNSPYSASKTHLENKSVVIKTEAGTKGVLAAKKAGEIILGSFLNCSAVVKYIKNKNPKTVTLVPMGDYGKRKNVEDEVFAAYLKNLLEGEKLEDFKKIKNKIKKGSLRNIFRSVFLGKHIETSLQLDTSKVVPKLENGKFSAYKNL